MLHLIVEVTPTTTPPYSWVVVIVPTSTLVYVLTVSYTFRRFQVRLLMDFHCFALLFNCFSLLFVYVYELTVSEARLRFEGSHCFSLIFGGNAHLQSTEMCQWLDRNVPVTRSKRGSDSIETCQWLDRNVPAIRSKRGNDFEDIRNETRASPSP